jgi:hypothetical protein
MLELFLFCNSSTIQQANFNSSCFELSPEAIVAKHPSTLKSSAVLTDLRKSLDVIYEDEFISTAIGTKTRSSFFIRFTNTSSSSRVRPTYISYNLTDINGNIFYSGVYSIAPTGQGDTGMVPNGKRSARVDLHEMRREYREYLDSEYNVEIISVGYDQSRHR